MHKFSAWTHLSNFDQSEYKHWTKSVTNAWPWWENSKAGWMSRPRSVWNQNFKGAAHKHNIFHMNSKRKNLQPAIIWKLVTCQRITSKKMVDLDGLTPEPAIRTGDTGQQIPFFVNWSQHWCAIWVQYQFSCVPKLARKREIENWIPCGAEDARAV